MLAALLLLCADLRVDRVSPPSWWSTTEKQTITLLVEGSDLNGARVVAVGEGIAIARIDDPGNGRALFLDIEIAAGARPRPVTLTFQAKGPAVETRWDLLA